MLTLGAWDNAYTGRYGGPERADICQVLLWEGVVHLKGLIRIVVTLGGCGGLTRTIFSLLGDFGLLVLPNCNL